MTALVGSLNVQINVLLPSFESVYCGVCLAFKIGVDIARCTGNVNAFHICAFCNSLDEVNGRNDITVDGRKFSGNAQYVKNGRVMHHGTLLFDSQLEIAAKALQPDPDKIKAKGVASVRSRITNLKPLLPEGTTLNAFENALLRALFENAQMESYRLTDADIAAITALKESRYDTWAWNWGASPACDMTFSGRIEGCGKVELRFRVEKGCITEAALFGDFFAAGDLTALTDAFIGMPATAEGLRAAAEKADVNCIVGLTQQNLLDIFLR